MRREAEEAVVGPSATEQRPPSASPADGPTGYVRRWPGREGVRSAWPVWLPESVRAAFEQAGIPAPWLHQVEAAEAAWQGRHVALSTGTASGKSLGYLMPVLASTYAGLDPAGPVRSTPQGTAAWRAAGQAHTALYLSPTKALAHDQLRACTNLALPGWPVAAVDGDTEPELRDWAREQAALVFTNPDLLHFSLLPGHQRWSRFLAGLRFVVVDEAHRYRGVFGSQVALVLRRLRRVAAAHGACPTFVVASATAVDATTSTAALLGVGAEEVTTVALDHSARGPVEVELRRPEVPVEDETAAVLARSVLSGCQTIAFVPSRRGAEVVAQRAQRHLDVSTADTAVAARLASGVGGRSDADAEPAAPRIAAYRGGFLAEDRRRLERALSEGRLAGVAATNALELGVDIAGMDAVVLAGFPGTRSAFWQQAGRAGRRGRPARVTLLTRPHPLDAYLLEHPDELLDAPVEATVLHPDNPHLLAPQLAAAAQELPLTEADTRWFGPTTTALVERLCASGALRRRPGGWYWTLPERAVDRIDLRGSRNGDVEIIESTSGRVLGHVDPATADRSVHPGAVYLHAGETFLAEELDHGEREALVRPARPGYLTQPQVTTTTTVLTEQRRRQLGRGQLHYGSIAVTEQVTGYLRRDEVLGTVWDATPLDLPEHRLQTTATWLTLDLAEVDDSLSLGRLTAGAHAVEHVCLALLPMHAPCDRWDVRGHAVSSHPDTGRLTVFFYDAQPAGFAEQGYEAGEAWLAAALNRLRACGCANGCPACAVSADCNGTQVGLDKSVAAELLALLQGPAC